MELVTRKPIITAYLKPSLDAYHTKGISACVFELEHQILNKKVKFPLLEFCGTKLFQEIASEEHITLCDEIEALKTEGGNVLLGIIMQHRLSVNFAQSLQKTTEYVSKAHIWYICDIIGERVYGYALLHEPDKTIPELKKLVEHPINWVIRSLGAGIHYAIKKGLLKEYVEVVFLLLLSKANSTDTEIRQGIGWAAKTTARYHPDIIDLYQKEIQDSEHVANWFRTKIKIGLDRNNYAKRN